MKNNPDDKNSQTLTDLFYMLNVGKELEKNYISPNNKPINKYINYINQQKEKNDSMINKNNNNNLKKEIHELKNTIISFEEKYGYNSPYHDDIIKKLKEKQSIKDLTIEISQKIYELFEKKFYNDCYDLWSIYNFKPLYNISPEENYEILRHLTKIKNELFRRQMILNNLENFNLFNDNNVYFENGISFRQMHDIKNFQNNNDNNNQEKNVSKVKNNLNNESFKTYNGDIIKRKMIENDLLLQEIKNRELNYSCS